jgi:hypothetical protein
VEDKAVTLREVTAEARVAPARRGRQAMSAPQFGQLLAGGRSARMRRDKAARPDRRSASLAAARRSR